MDSEIRPGASPGLPGSVSSKTYSFARHTLGICLLLIVVVLWTASNFLASTIFADDTYSKPFFVTYINTSIFILFLVSVVAGRLCRLWWHGELSKIKSWETFITYLDRHGMEVDVPTRAIPIHHDNERAEDDSLRARLLSPGQNNLDDSTFLVDSNTLTPKLGLRATAGLSFKFCMLWFVANYFAMACLQYTTVGSTTILTSTSGMWTLIFGAMIGVEKFTLRKFFGVLASLIGVILISRIDMSGPRTDPYSTTDPPAVAGRTAVDERTDGTFPHKSAAELALGDAMAAFSAVMYGVYTIVMKKQVKDESRVNMQLFFGLVGFFNVFIMWPGFLILHFLGIEEFEMPPTNRIWTIVLINSVSSLISDICWAYAMFLTTPLIVTVGLSLTIPLSLVGQIILQGQYAGALYWIGAVIVLLSFLLVNHESSTTIDSTSSNLIDSGSIGKGLNIQSSPHGDGAGTEYSNDGENTILPGQNAPLVR